jgi:sortase A
MNVRKTIVTVLQRTLLGVGAAALAYAGGSVVYGDVAQHAAARTFDRAPVDGHADLAEGDPVGRLELPRIGLSVMVLQGVSEPTLVAGAGHVPGTPSPGGDGNVVIAAHRDTFFRKLEGVVRGDRIQMATARGRYEYVVESSEVVDPEDTQVMESRARDELTLVTCYPFHYIGSAPKRFVVHARPR